MFGADCGDWTLAPWEWAALGVWILVALLSALEQRLESFSLGFFTSESAIRICLKVSYFRGYVTPL